MALRLTKEWSAFEPYQDTWAEAVDLNLPHFEMWSCQFVYLDKTTLEPRSEPIDLKILYFSEDGKLHNEVDHFGGYHGQILVQLSADSGFVQSTLYPNVPEDLRLLINCQLAELGLIPCGG